MHVLVKDDNIIRKFTRLNLKFASTKTYFHHYNYMKLMLVEFEFFFFSKFFKFFGSFNTHIKFKFIKHENNFKAKNALASSLTKLPNI